MRVIFTCGGTAGHINPALALAKVMKTKRPDTEVLFVGAAGPSMEATLVPQAGFPLKQVEVNSLRRKVNMEAVKHNLKALRNLGRSRRQAQAILDDFRPDLVVGTGGFASYPTLREAARRGIPTAVHESNAVPGLTTRRLAPHVDLVMAGLPSPKNTYPPKVKVLVTGTPVRPDFFAKTRKEARAALGLLEDKPLVLSYWGSLGAERMNELMVDFLARCAKENCPFYHIHGAGKLYFEKTLAGLDAKGVSLPDHPSLQVREYIYDMPLVMAAADVVLCRAGASTISELTALSKPAILVPSPNVTGDHQTKNARAVSDQGGGVLLPETECTPQRLWEEVNTLLSHPDRRHDMGEALSRLSPPDATAIIYDALMDLTRR